MKENEQQFTDIVRRNRSTIYTVCYMFSKDNDEVADMFQEVLIDCGTAWNPLTDAATSKHGFTVWH